MLKTILAIFGITIGIVGLALSVMGFKTKAPAYITAFFYHKQWLILPLPIFYWK